MFEVACIAHAKHPDLLPCRTRDKPLLVVFLVPNLWLMSKEWLVNLHRHSRSSEHQGWVTIEERPATDVSTVLICPNGCFLLYLGLLWSITDGILLCPPIEEDLPLLDWHSRVLKECPTTQAEWRLAGGDGTPPSIVAIELQCVLLWNETCICRRYHFCSPGSWAGCRLSRFCF